MSRAGLGSVGVRVLSGLGALALLVGCPELEILSSPPDAIAPHATDAQDDDAGHAADGGVMKAAAEPGPETPANREHIDWSTPFVKLQAEEFRIEVQGKTFLCESQSARASLNSNPGTRNAYTTFERIWTEHGVEMRLFIYFYSDGSDWWANEIRIYDGRTDADWLAATGEWFRRPLGQAFTGDLDLTLGVPAWSAAISGSRGPGQLTLHNLQLQAFRD